MWRILHISYQVELLSHIAHILAVKEERYINVMFWEKWPEVSSPTLVPNVYMPKLLLLLVHQSSNRTLLEDWDNIGTFFYFQAL
jgi:hypothetical protein